MKKKKKPEAVPNEWILALETATQISSVSLFGDGALMGTMEYSGQKRHAKLITVMMETLLRDLEVPRTALSAVMVGKGPGSYTGLRVGVSTAKGLAMALDLPLLSINSLEALAWQVQSLAVQQNAWICPMIDARRMEVYCALYNSNIEEQEATEAKIIEPGAFESLLSERKVIFIGNGVAKCKDILASSSNAILLENLGCTSRSMGTVAVQKLQNKDHEDLVTFEPYYLKDFIALKPKNPLI